MNDKPDPGLSTAVEAGPYPSATAAWDYATLQLDKAGLAVVQSLNGDAQPRACIVVYSGADIGRRFSLEGDVLRIGRAPDMQAQIDDPGISRRHAELRAEGDAVSLRDLGSSNGTQLNGAGIEGPVPLADGDLIRLGEVVLKFYGRHSQDALLHDRIYRMATVDAGTGVFSKRYLLDTLEREIRAARRAGLPLSVVCIDLDHFKSVNDRWGHMAGDAVLQAAAAAVLGAVRRNDIVGRIGGEEFVVLMPGTALPAALESAERMRSALAGQTIALGASESSGTGAVLHVQTASLGVATLTEALRHGKDLIDAADLQMYVAKRSGRNAVRPLGG